MTESNLSDALSADVFGKMMVGAAADWQRAGITPYRLRALVAAGELVQIRRGAYATNVILTEATRDPCLRHALDVAAARALRGHTGVASHQSAATLYGLPLLTPPPEGTVALTVPPGKRKGGYSRSDVICHTADLPEDHVTRRYGLPVTTGGRTVVDLARMSPFMDGVVTADAALHERHTSKTDLRRVLARCARWPGIATAKAAIDFADQLAESPLESCARVVFHEQGLPPPQLQVPVFGSNGKLIARVDFMWQKQRVIVEADGLLKYDSGETAIKELARDRLLREAGYEVVHFTWKELLTDPERVISRIRAAFVRQSHLASMPP